MRRPPTVAPEGRVELAGVPIDRIDMRAAVERMGHAIATRDQVHVATVNMDFLMRAQRHRELREVLARSELNVADGAPIVWLSRILGRPVPGRVAGADLVPELMAEAARRGARVFLLGGEGGVAEQAAARLSREFPGLRIGGCHEPPRASLDAMDSDHIVELVNRSDADVLLVALGNPKQELWIARHRHRLRRVSVAVGVGCVFDLLAERARRAPAWMQRAGLEWLHRLVAEPRRLAGRYLACGTWLLLIATGSLYRRARAGRSD